MVDENRKIKIKWNSSNIQYFVEKGYVYTKQLDEFEVPIKDLPDNASYEIEDNCDCCGKPMKIRYYDYRRKMDKYGVNYCRKCAWNHTLKERQQKYFDMCMDICNCEGYKFLTAKEDIKGYHEYIEYECPKHGIRKMKLGNFLSGKRCSLCRNRDQGNRKKLPKEEVEKRIIDCGGYCHNANEYVNNRTKNLLIDCPRCGKPFTTSLEHFVQHGGQLCPDCYRKESIGENKIRKYLESHDIPYESQHWFPDCRDVKPLPFDFVLLTNKVVLIEFDGEQHTIDNHFFNYSFEKNQLHDKIKTQYCIDNGYELIRINYTDINKIDKILDERLRNFGII